MRTLVIAFVVMCVATAVWGDQGHEHALTEEEVGAVHFPTSCAPALATRFNRSVALLHSFQYEQARESFEKIAADDPGCPMAYWGIAMSHYHGLWRNGDTIAGRQALIHAKQLTTQSAATTAREVAYIDALAEVYREDGKGAPAHGQAFEQKMAELQAAYPDDSEAAIFHALALDITASKTDKTFTNQKRCVEILQPIFLQQPHHPGVAHYLIHCSDNPVLAEQSLVPARMYAKIAPASAHANHMPSHIFTRVGSWDESIASNLRSAELAAAAEPTARSGEARDQRLHAMDYLEYAYLQTGRVKQAAAVLNEMRQLPPRSGLTLTGDYALAAIPARYTMELGKWDEASALEVRTESVPWAQAITWMAVGIGGARAGKPERAAQAEQALAGLRDASAKQDPYWSNQIEVQRREVSAWIARQKGKPDDALALMRTAVDLEESMDKDPVTPGPVVPARESLADMLSLGHESRDALAEYETVLKVAPNRFNALHGAAVAAEEAGATAAAEGYWLQMTTVATGDERPELVEARKKLAAKPDRSSGQAKN